MKKALALVLSICMLLAAAPAFALDLLSGADTYPITTDKTITFYDQGAINPHEKFASWKESPFHTGLIEMTGINIDFSFPHDRY